MSEWRGAVVSGLRSDGEATREDAALKSPVTEQEKERERQCLGQL